MTKQVASEGEIRSINQCFPLIKQIKSDDIREKVIEAWMRVWRASGHARLERAPHLPSDKPPQQTLVKHINASVEAALAVARQFEEEYGIPVNFDYLIAAAILHDVDNLVIYEEKEGRIEQSELGKMIPHGVYGAYIALEVGLPLEIVHVIATHTPQCAVDCRTIEGVIIVHCERAKLYALRTQIDR